MRASHVPAGGLLGPEKAQPMAQSTSRLSKEVRIRNELGLHARAAAKIAKTVAKATAAVWITKNGETVDASSIIDILTLACPQDTLITVAVDDPRDADILNAIEVMVETGFGE